MTLSVNMFAATMIGGGALFGVVSIIDWVNDYRALRRAGVCIPRRGFRLWALCTWVIATLALTGMFPVMQTPWVLWLIGPYREVVNLVLLIVELVLAISFWPGAIITALYVRRISKYARWTPAERNRQWAKEKPSPEPQPFVPS